MQCPITTDRACFSHAPDVCPLSGASDEGKTGIFNNSLVHCDLFAKSFPGQQMFVLETVSKEDWEVVKSQDQTRQKWK